MYGRNVDTFDRRQRVFRHIAPRIMAATEQTKLPHDAELVAKGDGLASGDSCAPSCYRVIESFASLARATHAGAISHDRSRRVANGGPSR
jgi:hypothetical protein